MSELSDAAAALGVPEPILKRSAEARAAATGSTVEEILAAWAGGAPAPEAPKRDDEVPAKPEPDAELPPPAAEPDAGRSVDQVVEEADVYGTRVAPRTTHHAPPVLVGRVERTGALVAGVVGLLILSLLLAVAAPAAPMDTDSIRSSNLPYTAAGLEGRQVYLEAGCATCHTQLVRNIVSDIGLGPVTLPDTNQVTGIRRYGPDLSAVGRRITDPATFESVIRGNANHPAAAGLSQEEVANLIAYLLESR